MRRSATVLAVATLWGCMTVPPGEEPPTALCGTGLDAWAEFLNDVDDLGGEALMQEYTSTLQRFLARPKDADRLRLSYLLSRPQLPVRNVERSGVLLEEIDPEGACAPYAILMDRVLASEQALDTAREDLRKLRSQLEALKGIDADLTNGQQEIEELTP